MEESTAILTSDNRSTGVEQVPPIAAKQVGGHYTNTPTIEAEEKLNRVFEEYSSRIESFVLMLETLHEGIVIINKTGEVCFTNEAGNLLLADIKPHLQYRELNIEESTAIASGTDHEIDIRTGNFFWNGEACNIFTLHKKEIVKSAEAISVPTSPGAKGPFDTLMSYMQQIAGYETTGNTAGVVASAAMAGKTIAQSEKLLGDIKTYIGLAGYQPVVSPVSMQKTVGDVLKAMGPEIEEAGVEVTVSDLPETKADKELMLKLIKQLLHNALKFRNTTRRATIDIGHDMIDGQYIFCVSDNGIGISKKHHEEVFNLFSILNDSNEYPGNGMGLAICKKIVELHDGKIWVESLPGHGSNFYFKINGK